MLAKVRSVVSKSSSRSNDGIEAEETNVSFATLSSQIPIDSQRIGMANVTDSNSNETLRFVYSRPEFLYFSEEEMTLSADRSIRPVLVPKDPLRMPVFAGYAEVINAGKTSKNEDQASARLINVIQFDYENCTPPGAQSSCIHIAGTNGENMKTRSSDDDLFQLPNGPVSPDDNSTLPHCECVYFGVFDGHAGTEAAVMSAKCLHEHIKSRLGQVLETMLHLDHHEHLLGQSLAIVHSDYRLTRDTLVMGALETAFVDMDEQIAEEKAIWRIPGGSTACVALFLLGRLYVANAGDCRALFVGSDRWQALSNDWTPDVDRQRLQLLAYQHPNLIGPHFTRLEYSRCLSRKDLMKKVLYRDWYMNGWAVKTVQETDLRPPLISNRARKRRLLNTIGVSRGFGDHHLMTADYRIAIKPFLTPIPEIRVLDPESLSSLSDSDVLIIASDGLWDVLSNEQAAAIVRSSLTQTVDEDENSKYTLAAQDLVMVARGYPDDSGRWRMDDGVNSSASTDDISVFVIPLKHALAPHLDDDDDQLLKDVGSE